MRLVGVTHENSGIWQRYGGIIWLREVIALTTKTKLSVVYHLRAIKERFLHHHRCKYSTVTSAMVTTGLEASTFYLITRT